MVYLITLGRIDIIENWKSSSSRHERHSLEVDSGGEGLVSVTGECINRDPRGAPSPSLSIFSTRDCEFSIAKQNPCFVVFENQTQYSDSFEE